MGKVSLKRKLIRLMFVLIYLIINNGKKMNRSLSFLGKWNVDECLFIGCFIN